MPISPASPLPCIPPAKPSTSRRQAKGKSPSVEQPCPIAPNTRISERFGTRLRELRLRKRWTQDQMAYRFGIDRSYLSEVELGKTSMSLRLLETIAVGFKMSLAELLDGL